MDDFSPPLSDLNSASDKSNNFVALAKETYKVMEPYRNRSETAAKTMRQSMSGIVLPSDYFKKLQLDISLPFAQIAKETAELSKMIDEQLFAKQFELAMQQTSRMLQAADGPGALVPVEEAEELCRQVKPIIPENAAAAVEQRIEVTKKTGNKLTWHDILEIITFIFLILNFVKDLLPDNHDQIVESEMVSVIENQEKQAQLMEDMYQIFDGLSEQFQRAEDLVNPAAEDAVVNRQDENADP